MAMDYVFPKGNERGLVLMAKRLGYSDLCLVYEVAQPNLGQIKAKVKELQENSPIVLKVGVIVDRRDAQRFKGTADALVGIGLDDVRPLIESRAVDVLFEMERVARKDSFHHRNSGMNQVIAKLMVEKGVQLGVSFRAVLFARSDRERATFMGRIAQNLMFAKKYGVGVVVASCAQAPFEMRSEHDMGALIQVV